MENLVASRLLLIPLALQLLIVASYAVPATTDFDVDIRSYRSMKEAIVLHDVEDSAEVVEAEEANLEEETFGRRALQANDYPGSGPNDRHTPKPPGA